jgi:hypothetical protein
VSAAEFAFLAAGLLVGAAGGAVVRGRLLARSRRPQVRITIEPGAVPRRRASTLAVNPFDAGLDRPAAGGPGDPAEAVGGADAGLVAVAVRGHGDGPGRTADRTSVSKTVPERVAIPIVQEPDPLLATLLLEPELVVAGSPALASEDRARASMGSRSRVAGSVGRGLARIVQRDTPAGGVDGLRDGDGDGPPNPWPGHPAEGASPGASTGPDPDPCRDLELEEAEQCRLAEEAHARVERLLAELAAATAHRDRQAEATRSAEATAAGNGIRQARAAARADFAAAREGATSAESLAEAANAWLAEVDRISAQAAEADAHLERMRAGLEIANATAEQLSRDVAAARAAAEAGDVACVYARRRAAECAGSLASSGAVAESDGLEAAAATGEADAELALEGDAPHGEGALGVAAAEGRATMPPTGARRVVLPPRPEMATEATPAVERVLAGEHEVLDQIVARIAADDAGRSHWTDRLTSLLETVLLHAVDAAAIDVPPDHAFWGAFEPEQSREILAALASLGHHFDGLGGWLDDRAPDQRDLALAVAHAGLDPMRVRRWPTNAESAELLRDAVILGADYLAAVAPALTVEELRAALGRESQAFEDIWAEWDRLRPALVATEADPG